MRPTESQVRRGLDLFAAHERLGAFDAVLAAAVLDTAHLTGIASGDRAFGAVPDLGFIDVTDPKALTLLGL